MKFMRSFRSAFFVWWLAIGLVVATPTVAQPGFLVNETGRIVFYVSSVSANGIPVGSDTNTGGATDPFLTLTKAIQVAPSSGATILMNGTLASPVTYTSSLLNSVSTQIPTLSAVVDYGAIVAGASGAGTAAITMIGGANLSLGNVIVDPSLNADGPAAKCIDLTSTLSATALTVNKTKFQGWSTSCILLNGGRLDATYTDAIFNGGAVNNAILYGSWALGNFVWNGGSCTLTAVQAGTVNGCIVVIANAAGRSFSLNNFTCNVTLDPSVTATNYFCARVVNVAGATMQNSTGSVVGNFAGVSAAVFQADRNNTVFNADAPLMKNLTAFNGTSGGYGCKIGAETAAANLVIDSPVIDGCNATGSDSAAVGDMHGTFLGNTSNGTIKNSTLINTGTPLVDKNTTNSHVTLNTASGFLSAGLLAKSAVNALYDFNQVSQIAGRDGGVAFRAENDTIGPALNSSVTLTSNQFINGGGTNTFMIVVDLNNTFTPSSNTYGPNSSGTLGTNPFQVNTVSPTAYANCSAYKAAVEPNAVCLIP